MRKKYCFFLSLFLFFLIFIFFFSSKILAADAYITGCLKVVNTYKPSCISVYSCLDFPQGFDLNLIGGKADHAVLIEGTGLPEGKDIYVVGCISTAAGIQCTTGDASLNQQVRQLGFTVTDNPAYNYFFKAAENPTRVRNGKVSVIVRSYTSTGQNHLFFGIAGVTQAEYAGEARTVQYGTFGFSEDPQKCISIRWDPRGRVFDSRSLEPLPGVTVSLLNANKNLVNEIGIENPFITKEDGLFNFFVSSGKYYLNPEKANYEFPVNPVDVNPNYNQIYYCDKKISQSLYHEQKEINEENEVLHCDVPLKPSGTPFQANEPTLMEYGYLVMENSHRFFGRFSHPLTIVRLTQGDKTISETTSDRFGNWEITVSNEKIASIGGNLEVVGVKNPTLYSNSSGSTRRPSFFKQLVSLFFKNVFSQEIKTNKIVLEPILRHLEGYTYDTNGEPIAYAKVRIITQMDNRVFFQTQADEKGFFVIYSNQLPVFPYFLEFTSPTNPKIKISTTTSQFILRNKRYLEENKINLISAKKNNQLIATSSSYITPSIEITNIPTIPEVSPQLPYPDFVEKTRRREILTIVAILVSLIVIAGSLIFYFWKKKMKEQQNLPPL